MGIKEFAGYSTFVSFKKIYDMWMFIFKFSNSKHEWTKDYYRRIKLLEFKLLCYSTVRWQRRNQTSVNNKFWSVNKNTITKGYVLIMRSTSSTSKIEQIIPMVCDSHETIIEFPEKCLTAQHFPYWFFSFVLFALIHDFHHIH